MTRNSLERRKVFFGRLASLSVIAFVVALALLSAACNNVNLTGEGGVLFPLPLMRFLPRKSAVQFLLPFGVLLGTTVPTL